MEVPPSNLIFFYQEAILQFGFISLFANSFPLAPIFSFLTNLLEIQIKLDGMCKFNRRILPEGASDIGTW